CSSDTDCGEMVPAALVIRNPMETEKPASSGGQKGNPEKKREVNRPGLGELEYREMLRTGTFAMQFVMLLFSMVSAQIIISQIAQIARVLSGWTGGFILVMILAVFNTGSRFVFPTLSDRIGIYPAFMIVIILQLVNMLGFSFVYRTPLLLGIGVAVSGTCFGAYVPLIQLAVGHEFGLRNLATNFGFIFLASMIASMLGSSVSAGIFDATGSYVPAFLGTAVMLLLAAVLNLKLAKTVSMC
ncbi:MAG: hypothetical protein IJ236_01215, partial [Oscillospiraceae bacterium]|nr:hypothetical protein [Oscillospiraceae bacterium]